jgi:endonuclease/exonuclease/phosphatase family metal-dependent hydrolase
LTNELGGGARRPRITLLALFALAITALLAPAVGTAAKHKKKPPKVTVMTRNLYLGADLGPAINAPNLCDAIDAARVIINQVDLTDFPARAKLLAKEIDKSHADLVGLQEVALWRDQTPSDYTTTPATHVRYDFLKSLQQELKARGANYKVAVKQDEFDQELPADMDDNDATGSGPAAFCGADLDGRLTMRDVILVRKGSGVKTKDPDMGHFENRYSVKLGGLVPINVDRGWVSVIAKVAKTKKTKGATFKFVNTHLEAFGDPRIRENQARELVGDSGSGDPYATAAPLQTKKQLIFVGDINSGGPKDHVGPGYTDPGDSGAYNVLTQEFGMFNLGARQTCCYPDPNLNTATIGSYRFDHTVDHVMTKPKLKQVDAQVTGSDPTVTTPSGLVSSDHGGLWSTLKLKKKK